MAYTTYTPTATKFVDVDLPDDSELETSGIGAIDTPAETLADGLLWCTDAVRCVWDASADTLDEVAFNCDQAVSATWQNSGIALTIPSYVGDRTQVTFCFDTEPNSATDAAFRIVSSATGLAADGTYRKVIGANRVPQTITFAFQAIATADVTYTLECICATAGDWTVYENWAISAISVRRV